MDHGGGGLLGENFMVCQIFETFLEEEGKISTMDGKRRSKPFSPNWKSLCVMDFKQNKCAPIVGRKQSGWLWCGV